MVTLEYVHQQSLALELVLVDRLVKMKKTIIITMLMVYLLVNLVFAADFVFKQSTEIDFKIPCFNSTNDFCPATTDCTLTVTNQSLTIIINNQNMTHNTSFYNYTIPATNLSSLGEYKATIQCTDVTESGYYIVTFEVTEDGTPSAIKETNRDIREVGVTVLIIVFILILFIVGLYKEDPTLTALSGLLFMAQGVFIAINGISTLNNSFVNGFALLLIGLGAYITIRSYIDSDEFQNM